VYTYRAKNNNIRAKEWLRPSFADNAVIRSGPVSSTRIPAVPTPPHGPTDDHARAATVVPAVAISPSAVAQISDRDGLVPHTSTHHPVNVNVNVDVASNSLSLSTAADSVAVVAVPAPATDIDATTSAEIILERAHAQIQTHAKHEHTSSCCLMM
jgi:hypothetical protein